MTAPPLALRRLGEGRLRVHLGGTADAAAREVLAWLRNQEEVEHVAVESETGSVEIRYRQPKTAAGAFLVNLRDRLFAANRAPAPAGFRVVLVHRMRGRARFRAEGATIDELLGLSAWLEQQPGVHRARPAPAGCSVVVLYDEATTTDVALLAAIADTAPQDWPPAKTLANRSIGWTRLALDTAVLAATATGIVPSPVAAAAVAATAVPVARRALDALRRRRASIDLLDLAAIGISVGTGQPATGAFITWLLGLGDLVLEHTQDRARQAISKLMHLEATDAWRIGPGGALERVGVRSLSPGDRVVVEAGERVPADGLIVRGVAAVDEKALTGESLPRVRKRGDRLLAASVIVEGHAVVELDRVGGDTTAARIVQILEGAGAKPMTLQRHAEAVAERLVVPTFGIAGAAALAAAQLDRMTSILITDFGTGVRIAVPTSALAAMTVAARGGILVKGGQYLERLAAADVIVFDKTGTLTCGEPRVRAVHPCGRWPLREVMALAAAAEQRQVHPVAAAIKAYAADLGLPVPVAEVGGHEYTIGSGLRAEVAGREVLVGGRRLMRARGVRIDGPEGEVERHRAAGESVLYVAVDGALQALVAYADAPRPESASVVSALRGGGRRSVVLLSGDGRAPVEALARALGADAAYGELLPEQKVHKVEQLQREGHVVAMVGDGINDAPALAAADVGVSLDGGAAVALETADVVLLRGGLEKLPEAFAMGDGAMRHVRRGLALVIAPNAVAIALGALGLITPGVAALVNNGSTVAAALAALSPLLWSPKRQEPTP